MVLSGSTRLYSNTSSIFSIPHWSFHGPLLYASTFNCDLQDSNNPSGVSSRRHRRASPVRSHFSGSFIGEHTPSPSNTPELPTCWFSPRAPKKPTSSQRCLRSPRFNVNPEPNICIYGRGDILDVTHKPPFRHHRMRKSDILSDTHTHTHIGRDNIWSQISVTLSADFK